MSRAFAPHVLTANDLRLGDVVYLTAADTWSRDLKEAEILEDEAHAQWRLIEASAQSGTVVGVYLAAVKPGPNGPEPAHFREGFRARGPSNYAHGKQAELS